MERTLLNFLVNWLDSTARKPLVIRGARQVGKTWLVRHLANVAGRQLIELNFEKRPSASSYFVSNDPQQILLNLSAITKQKITPENCLLFLDEIQTDPQLLSKLRWFAEDMPQLPVIAASSLLEFVLAEHSFSMPVGRISYAHLEPMSFEEFLQARDQKALCHYLHGYDFDLSIPIAIHEQLMQLFKEYLVVGGLPAAVESWVTEFSLNEVSRIHNDLLATYRDDFAKYKGRVATEILDEVVMSVPKMLGRKFVYSHLDINAPSETIKKVVKLLGRARICHRVSGCSANGVPLAAETKDKYFKEVFIDTGLSSTSLGLDLPRYNATKEIAMVNRGAIAEQVVAQLLRTIDPPYVEPALYCWRRAEPGSSAEVDYIIQHGNQVIPIEVKAGATGSLKSLHLFMSIKKLPLAIRINSDLPNSVNVNTISHAANSIEYKLLSIPFYLIGQLHRLISIEEEKK